MEKTLAIHCFGLVERLGKSLTTTIVIENINSHLRKNLCRIKHWITPDMKYRWVATSMLEIEKKMRRINNYEKMYLLRISIKSEWKLSQRLIKNMKFGSLYKIPIKFNFMLSRKILHSKFFQSNSEIFRIANQIALKFSLFHYFYLEQKMLLLSYEKTINNWRRTGLS